MRSQSGRGRFPLRPAPGPSDPAAPGTRLASFRRLYRWLNLTLVHQGTWPLLVLMAGAPAIRPASASFPWELAATGAPLAAALLALLYLAQRTNAPVPPRSTPGPGDGPPGPAILGGDGVSRTGPFARSRDAGEQSPPAATHSPQNWGAGGARQGAGGAYWGTRQGAGEALSGQLQAQARILLFGLALVIAGARLVIGPTLPTAEFLLFGLADVAAFQLIHFGVVAGSFVEVDLGQAAAVLLFGLSWGLRELFLAGVGIGNADLGLAFAGGLAVGLGVGLMSRLLRRWPGGFWAAAAGHWLLIYLIFGFAG